MTTYQLAQLNVARMLAADDDPIMADFMNGLDRINRLGEQTPGFIWRLKGEADNALAIRVFEDPRLIINLTVWADLESLRRFTYYSDHAEFYRRRRDWFHKDDKPLLALWWLPAGTLPTPQEARGRLEYLHAHGPTPYAFTFRHPFSADDAAAYHPVSR